MRNLIKNILKEEVYNIFEDEDFDPLGHIGDEESDDPEELGIDLTEDCVLGFSNSNSKLEWPYFSLPAGYTCPFATVCKNFPAKWEGPIKGGEFKKPKSWEKNIKPGPEAKFMCYAARAQGQYPAPNVRVFKNLNLLNQYKTAKEMADLIVRSMEYHNIDDTDIFRIHEAGDFYNQEYFDAWLEVARRLPGTLFYVYTMSLPYWEARMGQIPRNFKLIASMDEGNEEEILEKGFRYAKVVNSVEEAKELGLPIDVDDSIAWGSDENFALLLHGPQPKGSEAAEALKRNKRAGMYGKEGVLSKAKARNQAKKDALRDKIRKELRKESFNEDLEYSYVSDASPEKNSYVMGPLEEDNEWGGTGRDLEMRGHRGYDKNIYVHRNLNAPPYFSIKKAGGATGGKVIGYDTSIHLKDVKFIVGEKGNLEVLPKELGGKGKAKNVHAGAVGKHVSSGLDYDTSKGWRLVRYNPRAGHKSFIYADNEEPIHNANEAILKNEKEVWVR